MKILAFDTSLGGCSAAVAVSGDGPPSVTGQFELRERQHAETILPMIEEVLAQARLDWNALDAIAVTSGPGSFTGVRVGVATARGFALALGKPLIAANSLDVLARQVADVESGATGDFAVAVDARRGEVYFATYDERAKRLSQPQALKPEQAAEVVTSQGLTRLAGSGANLVRETCYISNSNLVSDHLTIQPDARVLARMALDLPVLTEPLRPLYLRPPDAKPQTGKAVERQTSVT